MHYACVLWGAGIMHKGLSIRGLEDRGVRAIWGLRYSSKNLIVSKLNHTFADQSKEQDENKHNFHSGGGPLYEHPFLTALDIESEGLLCQSGEFNFDRADAGYGDNNMTEI